MPTLSNPCWTSLALLLVLSACQGTAGASDSNSLPPDGKSLASALPLRLIAEKRLAKLLPGKAYEASGVVVSQGQLFVASDNLGQIAAIDTALQSGSLGPGSAAASQYEGLTATDDGRFFAVVESAGPGGLGADIVELDSNTAVVARVPTDASFVQANKGFEGIAWLRVDGSEYLLALCENNACQSDDTTPGQGRVKVLNKVDGVWVTKATLHVPASATFVNYSDLALTPNPDGTYTAGIVSRKSAALWLGKLTTAPWALSGPSIYYVFPRTPDGAVQYCSVEGLSFLAPDVLALVSDKSDGSSDCVAKEESIHLFGTTE